VLAGHLQFATFNALSQAFAECLQCCRGYVCSVIVAAEYLTHSDHPGCPLRLSVVVEYLRSRNARLSPESRSNALSISAALNWAQQAVVQGEVTQADDIAGTVRQRIAAAGGDVDYVEVGLTRHQDSDADSACSAAARLPRMTLANLGLRVPLLRKLLAIMCPQELV
jgi:hypothetical protein